MRQSQRRSRRRRVRGEVSGGGQAGQCQHERRQRTSLCKALFSELATWGSSKSSISSSSGNEVESLSTSSAGPSIVATLGVTHTDSPRSSPPSVCANGCQTKLQVTPTQESVSRYAVRSMSSGLRAGVTQPRCRVLTTSTPTHTHDFSFLVGTKVVVANLTHKFGNF